MRSFPKLLLMLVILGMPKVRGEEWSHVVDNGLDKNRNHIFTCKYCDRKFTGSASKIRIHLLGCVSTPVDVVLEMRYLDQILIF